MALLVILLTIGLSHSCSAVGDEALNITRLAGGDIFSLGGSDCGPTRCMEATHGTALSSMAAGLSCMCQCRADTPAFREDQRTCVSSIEECQMASFGRGATKPQIPFVFLPLKGQIIYPSKEIIFTDVENAICVVTSAQYLSNNGWVTLRDVIDNDVPFGLYRDEGKTFLQWRGSGTLHARLEGRLVAAHVLCSSQGPARLAASCAVFRVAGASHNSLLDVRSIPFHAGETITNELSPQNQGLSVLECLAIGVCVLMLIFVYAAGIVFYIHYKQRQKRKDKDPEMHRTNTLSTDNGSIDTRIDMDNIRMKTNPLLNLDSMGNDYLHDAVLSDVSEHTEDTIDSSPTNTQKFQKNSNVIISAMVHTRRKSKTIRPSLRSASSSERLNERMHKRSPSPDTFERAPHSDLSIVDCSVDANTNMHHSSPSENTEPALRRKLYFNPVFFENEHLKNPPPAAIDFLEKIREVMSIAKEKMTSKRFIPILSDIPEEELYHTIDLGWDIPCARRGRRFSAISLKRENSRRAVHCGGCPGCDSSSVREQKVTLVRSNSCKSCVSDDYKQKIVRKWLDEVPSPPQTVKPVKSVAKVSGTPRVIEPKKDEEPIAVAIPISVQPIQPNRIDIPKTPKQIPEIKVTAPVVKEFPKEPPRLVLEENKEIKLQDSKIGVEQIKIIHNYPNAKTKSTGAIGPKNVCHATRRIRKKLPPPPPPPTEPPPAPPTMKLEEPEPIPPEIKKKMEAVIQELNLCKRSDPIPIEEIKIETVIPIAPKIIIPVLAAESNYYSDDNVMLAERRKQLQREPLVEMDSLDRTMLKKRRFSVACGPELDKKHEIKRQPSFNISHDNLSRSWRDVRQAVESFHLTKPVDSSLSEYENHSLPVSGIFIKNNEEEPLYDNVPKPGPLTIQVRGSPVENRRNLEQFDPDTLDRKPKRDAKTRVDKILLKSGGSFKYKSIVTDDAEKLRNSPENAFTRKIGSLREIYEAKAKTQVEVERFNIYERRGSTAMSYDSDDIAAFVRSIKTPDLLRNTEHKEFKPPVPPKQRRGPELPSKFISSTRESPPGDRKRSPEEKDRFPPYIRSENLNARRSGRRSNRTRSRRTDLRKLYRTEDSGYLSTDSNESKRRARYLLQLKPRNMLPEITQVPIKPVTQINRSPPLQIESDTDDFESLCDGRSESGGESVETDSVFFGHFDESKQMLAELGFETQGKMFGSAQEQIDSGFAGETNIVLSGDSDSEHRSVISIKAGCDGRASAASISNLDESPYLHTVEC